MKLVITMDVEDDATFWNTHTGQEEPFADPDHPMGVTNGAYEWLLDSLPGENIDVRRG